LNNPRHLVVHNGRLYVAEAGKGGAGPCPTGPEGPACFGTSGSVATVDHGKVRRVLTGLPSVAGPDGSSAGGPASVAFADGNLAVLLQDLNIDPVTGANPFGDITAYRGGFSVTDAAANDLLYVDRWGHISVLAVFPAKMVLAPPQFRLPAGTKVPVQSVPTSVVVGPDGALYVSELSIIPGSARVYRVVPGKAPKVYASGFTALTDLAFDSHGRLLTLSFARESIIGPPSPGVLTRIERNGSRTVLASDGLESATGIAVSGDDVYLSNHGTSPGTGEILKLHLR
jgi:hypothetical protein